MGCGKSKHAVETATTVVKSSDGTKQTTTTTKTVTETADSSLIQKQVETKSLFLEDANKTTITTNVDPSGVANADPTLGENVVEEDVNDSNPTENVVKEDEKVGGVDNTDNVAPTSSKDDDVGVTKVVKEDEGERESTQKAEKADNVPPTEEEKVKESNLTKDNKTKNEFMTPTLSEDVVGPFEAGKGNKEVKDSKEENITAATSDEKPVKTTDGSSNPKDDNIKVEEQKLVAQAAESKKVEATIEDVEVTEVDIAKVKISPATETEKVPPTASKANVGEAQEKEA
ncbi:hypothetical protein SSX86_001574 [Deinandra increscens subsp. villosa]|uniref:Uncharacterized protein n=1 Tax=Deinandra increscens subsp. villosa TaxID=3103831 RepID=A0AAP0DRK8_9ASTR